jgi:hypothetical protein
MNPQGIRRIALASLLALLVAAGCAPQSPGKTRYLGEVPLGTAFEAAQEVLRRHRFAIAERDAAEGVIVSAPKEIDPPPERLLSRSDARQVATVRLRREGPGIAAQVSVALQRRQQNVQRTLRPPGENYDRLPNETPSALEAATTSEQNITWRQQGWARDAELAILNDLYRALNPSAAPAGP